MKKLVVALFVAAFSQWSIAANETIPNVSIIQFNTYDTFAIIYFSPEFAHSQEGCTGQKSRAVLRFSDVEVSKKEMYSAALAAAMAGKKVNLAISGCDSTGYPLIYRVDIKI